MTTLRHYLLGGAILLSSFVSGLGAGSGVMESRANAPMTILAENDATKARHAAELNAKRATVCVRTTETYGGGVLGAWISEHDDGKRDLSNAHKQAWEQYREENGLDAYLDKPWHPGLEGMIQRVATQEGSEPQYRARWYGTAFAYKEDAQYVYFATNYHVASGTRQKKNSWFFGNSLEQRVEVVNDIMDTFAQDNLTLEYVAGLSTKDMSVLRAPKKDVKRYNEQIELYNTRNPVKRAKRETIESFKGEIGDSDALKLGDKLVMYGYPHAVSRTRHTGQVTDDYFDMYIPGRWDHVSFMVDVTAAGGNSGSAVLLFDEQGKAHWVGQLNAGYRSGQNINFVIGINNYKRLLEKPYDIKKTDDTQERVTSLIKKANLENYHRLFKDVSKIRVDDKGAVHVVIYRQFPYEDAETIEFIDRKDTGYGTLDEIIAADAQKTRAFAGTKLAWSYTQKAQKLYNGLVELLQLSEGRHNLENVKPRTAYEHEQISRLMHETKLTEKEYQTLYQSIIQGMWSALKR